MNEENRGVLYVAWGSAHVAVARASAETVKRHNPHLKTAIFCNADDDATGFDIALPIPKGLARPKVPLLAQSPFEETLFLDNDTVIRADLTSLFRVLERYDMAGAQVVLWHRPKHMKKWRTDIPDAFPQINTGVLLYRRNAAVVDFVRQWADNYVAAEIGADQVTFRETLWHSDIQFHTLAPQFNKRVYEGSEAIYSDQEKPRILHLPILRPQKNKLYGWIADRIRKW